MIERQAHKRDHLRFKKTQKPTHQKNPIQTNKPNEPQKTTTGLYSFPKITLETRAGTKVSKIN